MILALSMGCYNLVTFMALLLGWPYLLGAYVFGHRVKWSQRLGWAPKSSGRPVWIHGASVGEMGVISPFFAQIRTLLPEREIVLSTMTATGQQRARQLFPDAAGIFFLPLDFWFSQSLALWRLRPRALVLTETELWPNLIWLCWQQQVPVFLVNARLSESSFAFYRLAIPLFGPLLSTMKLIACQSKEDADRYLALGVRPEIVTVTGNLKYDGIKSPATAREKADLRREFGLPPQDVVLVAGSVREEEELLVLQAWAQGCAVAAPRGGSCKLVIAPRHPGQFARVEFLLTSSNLRFAKRSGQKPDGPREEFDVLLLDTIGELVKAYAAGDMAFVGGSLVPLGGHNPLEPAALGLPVVFGQHMFNTKESASGLYSCHGAEVVKDAGELAVVLGDWMADAKKRGEFGERARAFVDSKRGATKITAELVAEEVRNGR